MSYNTTRLKDRIQAGKLLAKKLDYLSSEDCIVLAIPRGGVIIGNEIAKKLDCPLDIAISKKITPPDFPEFAIGAIACDGSLYKSENWKSYSSHPNFEKELEQKKSEVLRRLEFYRGSSDYNLKDKIVIVVDDGIATGATVFAILQWLEKQHVGKIVLAIPVMPPETFHRLKKLVSEIQVLSMPSDFSAVGQFYEEFSQVTDEEVMSVLKKNNS